MGERENIKNLDGNLEALRRYEDEMDRNEKINEHNEACMQGELDEAIEMIIEIFNKYEMREQGVEYVTDQI